MNPWGAVAEIVIGIYKARQVQAWTRLIFQMGFSAVASFLFVCGSTLIASRSWVLSIGSGMVTGSVVLVVFFRRSPLTRGMMAVLPGAEAKLEIDSDLQTISK